MNVFALTGLAIALSTGLSSQARAQQITTYTGSCDASAGAALAGNYFVVANDENDDLAIYQRGQMQPVSLLNITNFLNTAANEESDIEASATIGNRVYWMGSHSRNSKGHAQQSRHRLFATDIIAGKLPTLKPVGLPYSDLLNDLAQTDSLKPYRFENAARLAAEANGGLNIEGLAATPDGGLLIGFRSPLAHGRALIVPLTNPADVIKGQRAKLGTPIELDLGQRGIRSIEWLGSSYLIAAGPTAETGNFALYRWSGHASDAAILINKIDLKTLNPEALFAIPQSSQVQLLSDDGGVDMGGIACKQLPLNRQTFRSMIITPH